MSTAGMMKAVQKLVGKAATAVHDESSEHLKRIQEAAQAQQAAQQMYNQWSTTRAASNTSSNTYNTWPLYQQALSSPGVGSVQAPLAGAGAPSPYITTGYSQTVYQQPAPVLTLTDDQMTSFLAKLASFLTRGWECIRCHRIWSPQENGCEFCNFIDRLEGKDVDRDDNTATAA